jgi:chorismate dehydratase
MKKNSQYHTNISKTKNVPSVVNSEFHKRRVNAAFISSVTTRGCKCTDVGIVGIGAVYSVLLLKGEAKIDSASQTSNQLAKVMRLDGEVMIGDRALKYYLDSKNSSDKAIDLSLEWHERTKLPFVFARLCYHKHAAYIKKIAKNFSHTKIYIPQYILKEEAKKREISSLDARWYLEHIHYKLDYKAKKSLKIFLHL